MVLLGAFILGALRVPDDQCVTGKTSFNVASQCCGKDTVYKDIAVPYPESDQTRASVNDLIDAINRPLIYKKPKNVILIVNDGAGLEVNYAARLWQSEKAAKSGSFNGQMESYVTNLDKMPYTMTIKTHTIDQQTTDSGGATTAMFSGVKGQAGTINIKPNVALKSCTLPNSPDAVTPLSRLIKNKGRRKVGIVSNTRITHATPAGIYAVSGHRNWENDQDVGTGGKETSCNVPSIAKQLEDQLASKTIDVAMSGGKELLQQTSLAEGTFGTNFKFVNQGAEFAAVDWSQPLSESVFFMGGRNLTSGERSVTNFGGGMSFETERPASEPSFKDMTLAAVKQLKAKVDADPSSDGYFLMAESGLIDWVLHANHIQRSLNEMEVMDETIAAIKALAGDDTLIIVSADHSQGLSFAGYAGSGSSIVGYSQTSCTGAEPTPDWNKMEKTGCVYVDGSGRPVTTVTYAMGPGAKPMSDVVRSSTWNGYYSAISNHPQLGPIRNLFNPGLASSAQEQLCGASLNASKIGTAQSFYFTYPINELAGTACRTQEEVKDPYFSQPATYLAPFNSHSGIDTVTKCEGPLAHLCQGSKDNTYLSILMQYAMDLLPSA